MNTATASDSRPGLANGLAAHLGAHLGRTVQVGGLSRLAGGSSNETWAFDLRASGDGAEDGAPAAIPLVLRRSFVSGPLETRLDIEFELLKALHRLGLPVPQPWTCVLAPSPLQSPFMVISRAEGCDVRKLLAQQPRPSEPQRIGQTLVGVLAAIHAVDWATELAALRAPSPGNVARLEIERWAADIEAAPARSPLLLAALDWLRANAPSNARLCLVHGDFKANNLLFDAGRCTAVIDWELAHIGDPCEDLAWTLLWNTDQDLVNGLLSAEAFLASYAAASGTPPDPQRLFFWQVFSRIKLAAIFLRGLNTASAQAPARPMLIQLARAIPYLEQQLAGLLLTALDRQESAP